MSLSNLKKQLADNKNISGLEKEVILAWIDQAYVCGLNEGAEICLKNRQWPMEKKK